MQLVQQLCITTIMSLRQGITKDSMLKPPNAWNHVSETRQIRAGSHAACLCLMKVRKHGSSETFANFTLDLDFRRDFPLEFIIADVFKRFSSTPVSDIQRLKTYLPKRGSRIYNTDNPLKITSYPLPRKLDSVLPITLPMLCAPHVHCFPIELRAEKWVSLWATLIVLLRINNS